MEMTSLWTYLSKTSTNYPKLEAHLEVDVLIIGGGITGVTCAQELVAGGKKVAILEAEKIGVNTTGHSTGNLYIAVQPYYQEIVKKFNLEVATTIAESRRLAIDYIQQNTLTKNIHCKFKRRPWFFSTNDETKISFLEKEVETFKEMGLNIEYTTDLPYPFPFKKAAWIPDQARFNPYTYVLGVAKWLKENACDIYEFSRVHTIDEKEDFCTVYTDTASVRAKHVVIATHTPIGINTLQMYTAPYRSYAVAMQLQDDYYPEGHYWNLETPHYVISTHSLSSANPEVVVIAGSHHKVGQTKDASAHLDELKTTLSQLLQTSNVFCEWSAQHYHSADTVPYIGLASRSAKRVYTATGFFADGLSYGTIAGVVIANNILGKASDKLENIYNSRRHKPIASLGFLLKENLNVFKEYLRDLPKPFKDDYSDLKNGEGKVIQKNQDKWAVSRDETGKLHIVSAVCTHMKCIVAWNNAEKTWDCPCHGSRFKATGEVIEGPAVCSLRCIAKKDF